MGEKRSLFTSESVTMGHPDKVADQISDGVLDAIMAEDKNCRVACEVLVTTGITVVAGEITTACYADIPQVTRQTIKEIGYVDAAMGFDYNSCAIVTSIDKQSPDISRGVTANRKRRKPQGAGDQGMMFGYACRQTPQLMPAPVMWARQLVNGLARLRQRGALKYLRPDGKSQVTVEFAGRRPERIHTVVVSTQHDPSVKHGLLRKQIIEKLILGVLPRRMIDRGTIFHVNPTGRFVTGGPHGDSGLTGRKIISDTYGGWSRHGGGAFSGKDPSKVDRSAAYAVRHVAKNVVAAGLADECEVQVAYAIGVADPVSVNVDTNGTGRVSDEKICRLVAKHWDLRPAAIIKYFDLLRPIYKQTARYGHFGLEGEDYTWERTEKAKALKKDAGL